MSQMSRVDQTPGFPRTIASVWSGSVAISSAPAGPGSRASPGRRTRPRRTQRTAWRDGTSHLLFNPIEFMEKLAAITPRPAVSLVVYVVGRVSWRPGSACTLALAGRALRSPGARRHRAHGRHRPRTGSPRGAWAWPALMHRVFALDVSGESRPMAALPPTRRTVPGPAGQALWGRLDLAGRTAPQRNRRLSFLRAGRSRSIRRWYTP
jgi:hypothetical protein